MTQIPIGTYPIQTAEQIFDNISHYIQIGLESSYADMFAEITVEYAAQMIINGKQQKLCGQVVLGREYHGLAEEIAGQYKVPGIKQNVLLEYLKSHIKIGNKCDQVTASYDSLTQDIQDMTEVSHYDNMVNTINFLKKVMVDCDNERKALNTNIMVKSR